MEATPKRQMVGNWQWNSYVQLQIDFIHANTECPFKEAILAIKLRRATNPDNGNYQAATAHKITTHKLAPWIYNVWEYFELHFVLICSIIHFFYDTRSSIFQILSFRHCWKVNRAPVISSMWTPRAFRLLKIEKSCHTIIFSVFFYHFSFSFFIIF